MKLRVGESRRRQARGQFTRGPSSKKRTVVFGAVERGGKVRAQVIASSQGHVLRTKIGEFVLPASIVYTDDYSGYDLLSRRYTHHRINHRAKVYVDGNVHTQTIEGFFSLVKNGLRGVYHSVSAKWLQGYVNEYAWRYNHRDDPRAMFRLLLLRAAVGNLIRA